MFYLLQQYLIDHEAVSLPGWGTLRLKNIPAEFHSRDQLLTPPQMIIQWQEQTETPDFSIQPLIGFLSRSQNETEEDCFEKLHDFIGQLKQQLQTNGEANWPGLGVYTIGQENKGIAFKPDPFLLSYLKPQQASRIIKAGKSHEMLVGDNQTNTIDMQTFLQMQVKPEAPVEKDRWWIPALIGGILGIAIIVAKWTGIV
jgi:nucleoid DNA-binding protein